MTKNYYRKEYSEQQWIALINKAIEFGISRDGWAKKIHGRIQDASERVK